MRVFRGTRSGSADAVARHRTSTADSTNAGSSAGHKHPKPKRRSSSGAAAVAQALDTTMKNAIESLTQDDAESALVFALVHDTEFRLATAIASSYEDQLRKLVGLLMFQEMVDTLNWNELFRANSTTTAIIREYTCDLGMDFLQAALQDVVLELWDATESHEVNPQLLEDGEDLAANQARLEALADRILDRICAAAPCFPYQVAKIYRVLETEMLRLLDRDRRSNLSVPRLSAIGEDQRFSDERKSCASLPRLSSMGDDVADDSAQSQSQSQSQHSSLPSQLQPPGCSAAREEFLMHLGGLVFLRFICPALVVPHKLQLTPHATAPSKTLQRTLVLVAKLFQSLANNVEYGAREDYMAPFNAFLARNRAKLHRFYDHICQQAQNDSRRESMIARSQAMPRISQVWAGGANPAPAAVNLTGAATVGSPDEYLPVLREWIRANVDVLTKEVARNGRFRRRSNGILVSPGLKKAAPKPKRKLKSSKSLSPFPSVDMNIVKEVDDSDDDASNGGRKASASASSSRSCGASGGVSPEELDEIIGHVSHRNIQLMKLYYSKLSQKGLQRLLQAVDPLAAAEWTAYKCKHHIGVFRRSGGGGGARRAEKDRFVEMKASVVIRATPGRVYQYLRSLESISEWDEYAANVKKVEPIDESRVIMYRSHPKLSLWPTWLVKPRDSCDLHSFVEKTGRFDTFAVVMESIPRPDVPEIKGTVRMSYATGGFLVEPSFGEDAEHSRSADPAEGAFARLTCVVRADFKGILPRYLAESICFRQVLSVLAIRTRVEAAAPRITADSSWV
ncbi:hypothetical protein PybrP1_005198 [[Pythium] brassicae (nom. inval.)]|nr:hypothetical protein PybrP1_005198 [[Pythium] brassicae (nom. inval.)]